jgi:hypothetical protein
VAKPDDPTLELSSRGDNPLLQMHVADGAYADNEGAVTSVDWINRLVVYYSRPENIERRPFDRVLLIRIQAIPIRLERTIQPANSLAGWRAALLGPFDTMMRVRSASQTERGDLEINLLTRATLAEVRAARERVEREFQTDLAQVDQLEAILDELRQLADSTPGVQPDLERKFREIDDRLRLAEERLQRSQERRRTGQLRVESVVFDFQPSDGVPIPLSWKLTSRQQRQIDRTWERLAKGSWSNRPLEILDRYFDRLAATPAHRIAAKPE